MANNTSLSILRDTPLTSNIATEAWTSENFTFLSTTNDLSNKIVSNLSNVINTKLSTIADEVSAEVQRVDEISTSLSNYSLTSHTHSQYATRDDISAAINTLDSEVTGEAGAGKTLTSFSQTDGKVTAGFADIAITKSQVTDFPDIPEVDGKFVHLSGDKVSSDFALLAPDGKNALSGIANNSSGKMAIGYNAQAQTAQSTALGCSAKTTDYDSVAVGYTSETKGYSATAVGSQSKATKDNATAIGANANASNTYAIAIGRYANATNTNAIAIGYSYATNSNAITIGHLTQATGANSIQIGSTGSSAITNSTADTLQIWDKPLLERTGGKIFFDRIPTGTTSTTVAVGNHTHNTSDLINNAGFITSAQVDEKIDAARVKTMEYQGTVTTYADLPSSGNKQGDVWNVVSAYNENPPGTNYAWNGTTWDPLGGTIDVSVFATKAELNDLSVEVIDGLSNEVLPKLSTIGDLTIEQSQKINAISSTLTGMTPLSTTNAFSAEVFNEFSSVLYPDISALKDLVSAEVEKIDAISATYISGVIVNSTPKTVTNNVVDLGTVLTAHQSLSAYTPLSTTNAFSAEMVDGLSGEVLPKLSAIGDLTIEQSQKINAISSDLSNYALTSQIPTVNDGTLIIQKNGIFVQSFNANQSNSVTANISVPLSTSQLSNDSGFITKADVPLSNYTLLSTTNALISTINDELSGNINPKISSIADEVSAETVKLDELSGSLSAYAKLSATKLSVQDEYTEWVLSPSYISVDNPTSPWPAMVGKRLKLVLLNTGYETGWQLCLEDGTPCGGFFGNLSSTELSWSGSDGEWAGNFPVYAKRYKKGAVLGDQTSATLALENHSHALSDIANLPGVVQTGSYNDLLDKPTNFLSAETDPIFNNWLSGESIAAGNGATVGNVGVAIGKDANAINGIAIGNGAKSKQSGIAIGLSANNYITTNYAGVAIGYDSAAFGRTLILGYGTAIGYAAKATHGYSTALGHGAFSEALSAIQLGKGTNTTQRSLQVYDWQLLDGNGDIPYARISAELNDYLSKKETSTQTISGSVQIAGASNDYKFLGVGTDGTVVCLQRGDNTNIEGVVVYDAGTFTGTAMTISSLRYNGKNMLGGASDTVLTFPPASENGQIVTKPYALSTFALSSTVNQLSNEVVVEISSVINPKLSTIISLVSSEVDKLDEISGNLSNYVDISSHQIVSGEKIFTNTVRLSGSTGDEIWMTGGATNLDPQIVFFGSQGYTAGQTIGSSNDSGLYFSTNGKSGNSQSYCFPGGTDQYDTTEQIIATERYAKQARNVLPILTMTNSTVNLSADTYVYRVTDANNTGTFPTLVAPTDIVQTGDYYFTFEIEWTTAASLASYSVQYDWINYPEMQTDGTSHTYYITGRWDSGGSGATAFTLNCWRTK